MKRSISIIAALMILLASISFASADDLSDRYIGAMCVSDCSEWVSLREGPSSSSGRLAKVPLGALVIDCCWYDDDYIYCRYGNKTGYILSEYLSTFLETSNRYLGTMKVTGCDEWVSLRREPDSSSERLAQVNLDEVVFNCIPYSGSFTYCEYGGQKGFILSEYMENVTTNTDNSEWLAELSASPSKSSLLSFGTELLNESTGKYDLVAANSISGAGETLYAACYRDNEVIWCYETSTSFFTELTLTDAFIDGLGRVYIYNAERGLACIDIISGDVIWTIEDEGFGGSISHAFDSEGTLYIGGYYGPDPYAIDISGNILWNIELDPDIYWLYDIAVDGSCIKCSYESVYGFEGTVTIDKSGNILTIN